jgi:predicted ArsR family transcriptional regulator
MHSKIKPLFTKEMSTEERRILSCLKQRGELTMDEIGSLLSMSREALFQPITYLMGRGLVKDRKVEGIGKYPAIQSWGLKFSATDNDMTDSDSM